MKRFKTWLNEEYLEEELLLEASTGEGADTVGKLRELQVGQHLNGGKHMESYRAEGKTPEQTHDKLSKKSPQRKRGLGGTTLVHESDMGRIIELLPYGVR